MKNLKIHNILRIIVIVALFVGGVTLFRATRRQKSFPGSIASSKGDRDGLPVTVKRSPTLIKHAAPAKAKPSVLPEIQTKSVVTEPELCDNGTELADAIAGEYLFSFYSASDRDEFEKYAISHGVRIIDSMPVGNALRIGVNDRSMLQDLLRNAPVAVDWMPNTYVDIPERVEGKNPLAPRGGYTAFGKRALDWLGIDDNSGMGAGITVAVLDSGVAAAGALSGHSIERVNLGGETGDTGKHGTAVAAIIAGDGADTPGVAPGVDLISVKVLNDDGRGDAFTLAKGIVEAVDRGANIINMSLGSHSDSFILRKAVAYAVERNVLLVAAVGNDSTEGVLFPARYTDVMGVAAVDFNDEHLYFSNRGPEVDLAAPGAGVSVKMQEGEPDILFSGTSAASPFVAGAAAAIWSKDRSLSPQDVRNLLINYSNDAGAPGVDDFFGAGVLNVGRILERDKPGIYDMAVMVPNVENGADGGMIDISAQNRGTETIGQVRLDVEINGTAQTFNFFDVGAGATISQPFKLKDGLQGDAMDIRFSVTPSGVSDATPGNNAMYSRIRLKKQSD